MGLVDHNLMELKLFRLQLLKIILPEGQIHLLFSLAAFHSSSSCYNTETYQEQGGACFGTTFSLIHTALGDAAASGVALPCPDLSPSSTTGFNVNDDATFFASQNSRLQLCQFVSNSPICRASCQPLDLLQPLIMGPQRYNNE